MITRLAALEAKARHMEKGMKPWLDTQFETKDRWVQSRLDAFESRIIRQLSYGQTPNITGIKIEVVEIKRMVHKLYDRSVISEPEIETMVPTIHVLNIWEILELRFVYT